MGTAIKDPVPDWVKSSFVILDIWALWRSALSVRVPCRLLMHVGKMYSCYVHKDVRYLKVIHNKTAHDEGIRINEAMSHLPAYAAKPTTSQLSAHRKRAYLSHVITSREQTIPFQAATYITTDLHDTTTPCPRKNCNTVYVAITLANNIGF